jgi:hypothetical protein
MEHVPIPEQLAQHLVMSDFYFLFVYLFIFGTGA